jgi:WD40 repeat protein
MFGENLRLQNTISLPGDSFVRVSAVSPSGDIVAATCSDGKARVWDLSGKLRREIEFTGDWPVSLGFNFDGTRLAIGNHLGGVKVLDIRSGEPIFEFAESADVYNLAVSPDGGLIAAQAGTGAVEVRDIANKKFLVSLPAPYDTVTALAFSPDGRWLAIAGGDTSIRIYDARSGGLRCTAPDFLLETFALVFSADGRNLFAGEADGTIDTVDATSGKIISKEFKRSLSVYDLEISQNGKFLAAWYFDPDAKRKDLPLLIWDLTTKEVRTIELPPNTNADMFLADGQFVVTSGAKNQLLIWSAQAAH